MKIINSMRAYFTKQEYESVNFFWEELQLPDNCKKPMLQYINCESTPTSIKCGCLHTMVFLFYKKKNEGLTAFNMYTWLVKWFNESQKALAEEGEYLLKIEKNNIIEEVSMPKNGNLNVSEIKIDILVNKIQAI